jgi:uncharacterized protein YbjT (DUF2867 family)
MYVILGASGNTGQVVAENLLAREQKFASSAEMPLTYKLSPPKVPRYVSATSPKPRLLPKLSTKLTPPM